MTVQSTASFPLKNKKTITPKPKEEKYLIRTVGLKADVIITVTLETIDTHKQMEGKALLDSGATGLFMSRDFAKRNGIRLIKLDRPVQVKNVDGTPNKGGSITHQADLTMTYKGHQERATFEVCDLGRTELIIGSTWLNKHNPEINWQTGDVQFTRCTRECGQRKKEWKEGKKIWRTADRWELMEYLYEKEREIDFEFWLNNRRSDPSWEDAAENNCKEPAEYFASEKYPWIPYPVPRGHPMDNGKRQIHRAEMAASWGKPPKETPKKPAKELVPKEFHEYLGIFEQKASERMPVRKPWDHAIDLKPDFQPKKVKLFLMSPQEEEEVKAFVDDQLRKGYIRPSKSNQTSPVFFIAKKDGKKRMVQDYRHINKGTI